MTKAKWSYNQFEVYAKSFEEGDAVRAGGTWHEVVKDRKVLNESDEFSGLTVKGAKNLFRLNYNVDDRVEGVAAGFTNAATDKYEIVTLKDHEVKVGDKLVWLEEGYDHWDFGGVYIAYSNEYGQTVARDENGLGRIPRSENWGIIPRYETVKVEGKMKTEIGGTFDWSLEQIRAYAAAFREGDAVRKDDKWYEVTEVVDNTGIGSTVRFPLINRSLFERGSQLNEQYRTDIRVLGSPLGFKDDGVEGGYKVVTPKDYEVREGDKIVWLGEDQKQGNRSELTFGEVYVVSGWREGNDLVCKNDTTTELFASHLKEKGSTWGVIPLYENVKQKNDMSGKSKHSGNARKFKKGDRAKVTDGSYKGAEGSIEQSDEVGGGLLYAVMFDDEHRRWFEEEFLELVEDTEKSPEQEAFDYLLSRGGDATRGILKDEVSIWAKIHFRHKDYDELRQVINILERLEKEG